MERSQRVLSISVKFNAKILNGKKFRTRILFSVLSVWSSYSLDRKTEKVFMFKDFLPYKYSILNFTEIERAQRDLSIPVKIKTFRLKLKEL
jgi:hypothetical protein